MRIRAQRVQDLDAGGDEIERKRNKEPILTQTTNPEVYLPERETEVRWRVCLLARERRASSSTLQPVGSHQ